MHGHHHYHHLPLQRLAFRPDQAVGVLHLSSHEICSPAQTSGFATPNLHSNTAYVTNRRTIRCIFNDHYASQVRK
jgi:hypothetical protein